MPRPTHYANTHYAILCYGNPLRRDDGVGWVIGERLAGLLPEDTAEVRVLHQLTPELAEPISQARWVLFVDAAEGAKPGKVAWTKMQPGNFDAQPFTHRVEPASLLAAAQELYGHCPPARLITITGRDFGFGEGLSPEVAGVAEEVIGQIQHFLERMRLGIGG